MKESNIVELHTKEALIQFLNSIEEETIFKITIETISSADADEILNNE